MRYRIAENAKPQVVLLAIATAVSVLLWVISWYLPILSYVVYPLQLFATFIHEGGHALAAVLTGTSVQSLTVSPDTSGEVYSMGSGWFSQLFISSAGYLGTTAFGAGLLAWMRFGYSSKKALYASAGIVTVLTLVFGIAAPFWNLFANVTFGGMMFTLVSGLAIAAALFAVARFTKPKWANFALAFLAVQCLLNAMLSLFTLAFITATSSTPSDAANMAAATYIPSIVWVVIWIAVSIFMISVGLRIYAVSRTAKGGDTLFED